MKRDIETPHGVVHVKGNGHKRPLLSYLEARPRLDPTDFDYIVELGECEGHESLDGAHFGETVYCDGSCVGTPDEWHDRRLFEYRGSWYDLYDGFEFRDAPSWITDAGYEAWQTESAFSAVIVRHTEPYFGDRKLIDDGDSIVVGYAHW